MFASSSAATLVGRMLADLQGHIEDAVVEAGYAGLAVVMAIETVFPPIPSELVLPLAGFQVAKGTLGFLPALGASTLGAVLGALLLYAIARRRRAPRGAAPAPAAADHRARHRPRRPLVRPPRRGRSSCFGRLVPGIRSLVSVPAGLSEMPLRALPRRDRPRARCCGTRRCSARRTPGCAVRPRRGLRRAGRAPPSSSSPCSPASPASCGCAAARRAEKIGADAGAGRRGRAADGGAARARPARGGRGRRRDRQRRGRRVDGRRRRPTRSSCST